MFATSVGHAYPVGGMTSVEETPPIVRTLVDAIGAHLGAPARGRWRLELVFEDGRVREFYRHDGPLPAGALERDHVIPAESP